jgi:uncharacterized protein
VLRNKSGEVIVSQPNTQGEGAPELAPVVPEERIVVLDVLRGFALLGILIMNMGGFNAPWSAWAIQPKLFPGLIDRTAEFVTESIFAGKANSIFSFLFGLGMTIQMERAASRGSKLVPMYLRRLAVLFLIGAAHAMLIWNGDVLHVYAVLGLLLLALRRASDRLVFALIAVFLIAPVLRSGWALYFQEPPRLPISHYAALAREQMITYQHGTYWEQVVSRYHDYGEFYVASAPRLQGAIWMFASFSVTMLLGFYAGRKRLFEDVAANAARFRRVMWWCLGIGLLCAVNFSILKAIRPPPTGNPTVISFAMGTLFNLHRPLLCVAYIAAIALLFQRDRVRRLLLPLASAGSMPLTNYILQSVIATTIYNSYGLGLFGEVGPALGFAISLTIFAVQIVYSRIWLTHFRFGPLEWLWKGASYGKLPPLRIAPKPETAPAVST